MHQSESSLDRDSNAWIEMKEDTSVYSSTDNMQSSRFRVAPVRGDGSPSSQSAAEFEDAVSSPVTVAPLSDTDSDCSLFHRSGHLHNELWGTITRTTRGT